MKLKEKNKAISLRRRGYSYKNILKEVAVSKSTLSLWLRDIELNLNQQRTLLRGREVSRYAAALAKRHKREGDVRKIINRSKKDFSKYVKHDLFLSGLSLYWAEGDKNIQERVKFTNSDPHMILFMMKWFRDICSVDEGKFRIAVHVHNLHSVSDIKKYWSIVTKIPHEQFYKLYVKKSTLKYKKNPLYNGTCSIVVNSRTLFRTIVGWKLGLLDYFSLSSNM